MLSSYRAKIWAMLTFLPASPLFPISRPEAAANLNGWKLNLKNMIKQCNDSCYSKCNITHNKLI